MWIDLDRLWGCSSPRHAVDDAERESDKEERGGLVISPKKRKEREKSKIPLPSPFFLVFLGERRRRSLFDFFCACEKMIRVISKTFCRTEEEEAWKSAFWGDPNSPTDDFNKREEKKKIRGGGGGQRVVVFCVRC